MNDWMRSLELPPGGMRHVDLRSSSADCDVVLEARVSHLNLIVLPLPEQQRDVRELHFLDDDLLLSFCLLCHSMEIFKKWIFLFKKNLLASKYFMNIYF
jgi:hypothetical protein